MLKDVKTADTGTDAKRADAEEMIKLFLKMNDLKRALVFGFAQGIESTAGKAQDKQSA